MYDPKKAKIYREKYKEQIKAYRKKYYHEHKSSTKLKTEKLSADEIRKRHKRSAKAYKKKYPSKYSSYRANRRAKNRKAFVENIDRDIVWKRDKGLCGICGRDVKGKWHLDHIIPISKGGLHSYNNVQVSHPRCNLQKGNKI